jgi:hypothetical protein
LREEDKEEGEDLEGGSFFWGKFGEEGGGRNSEGDREEGGNWKNNCFGELSQGTVVAGNFGLGGQETTRIPGARELERLFLVGWEVNIQLGSLGKLKNK